MSVGRDDGRGEGEGGYGTCTVVYGDVRLLHLGFAAFLHELGVNFSVTTRGSPSPPYPPGVEFFQEDGSTVTEAMAVRGKTKGLPMGKACKEMSWCNGLGGLVADRPFVLGSYELCPAIMMGRYFLLVGRLSLLDCRQIPYPY